MYKRALSLHITITILYSQFRPINVIKKGTFMDMRTIMLLCTLLLALLPNCRKRTRQQKKVDKITKERIVSNF